MSTFILHNSNQNLSEATLTLNLTKDDFKMILKKRKKPIVSKLKLTIGCIVNLTGDILHSLLDVQAT